jgi:DNA-binding NarL/FixJ family response regulator
MPNREGIETIHSIRKSGSAVKIIAVSGAFGGEFLPVAERLGAHLFLDSDAAALLGVRNRRIGAAGRRRTPPDPRGAPWFKLQ